MKLALLAPAGAMHRFSGSFGKSLHYAPLTLTTLAALVPEELEAEVVIYDETAGKIPLDLDADLVGITCITGTAPRCYAFADYFRGQGKTVFIGGVHPSMLPEEAAQHADVVFTGFSEQTFPQFLRDRCIGCGRCEVSCADGGHQAIRLDEKRHPVLNGKKCVGCHLCLLVCPQRAIVRGKKRISKPKQ